jgi:hypothetical protein
MIVGLLAITVPSATIAFNLAGLSVGAMHSFAAIVTIAEQLGP